MIGRIATAYQEIGTQVTLRRRIQHCHIICAKLMHRERMQENMYILDFELSAEETASLDGLDQGERWRTGPSPKTLLQCPEGRAHRFRPFPEVEQERGAQEFRDSSAVGSPLRRTKRR